MTKAKENVKATTGKDMIVKLGAQWKGGSRSGRNKEGSRRKKMARLCIPR